VEFSGFPYSASSLIIWEKTANHIFFPYALWSQLTRHHLWTEPIVGN
jgi:hypothetical protein